MVIELLSKINRTKFESKSQPRSETTDSKTGCYQRSIEQSLKANHNKDATCYLGSMLLSKINRTKFESKSQLVTCEPLHYQSCYQRSIEQSLKANHNLLPTVS